MITYVFEMKFLSSYNEYLTQKIKVNAESLQKAFIKAIELNGSNNLRKIELSDYYQE